MIASIEATEQLLSTVLVQLVVMIGAARLFNSLFRRFGQPGVVGEIVAGLLLGPSLLGHVFPGASAALFGARAEPSITVISQIGLILLMFQIGCDFEFGRLRTPRLRRLTIRVAVASITVPFALGVGIGRSSAAALAPGIDPVIYSLFCGVALAITAVPILGRIIHDYGLARADTGLVAIAAAAINDVVGWVLLAGIAAFATSRFTGGFVAWHAGGLVVFVVVLRYGLAPLVPRLLARWPVDDGQVPANLMAVVLCLMFVLGLCTFRLGIFAIFGGFAAGLLFHWHAAFVDAWRRQVGRFVLVFFLPVFFTFTGLRTNLLGLTGPGDVMWLGLFIAAAVAGKVVPVYLAARLSGLSHRPAMILGTLMNTRALMELIVLNIGYDLGVLPHAVFTMLVIMAVATTVMTGPMLRLLLAGEAGTPQREKYEN